MRNLRTAGVPAEGRHPLDVMTCLIANDLLEWVLKTLLDQLFLPFEELLNTKRLLQSSILNTQQMLLSSGRTSTVPFFVHLPASKPNAHRLTLIQIIVIAASLSLSTLLVPLPLQSFLAGHLLLALVAHLLIFFLHSWHQFATYTVYRSD